MRVLPGFARPIPTRPWRRGFAAASLFLLASFSSAGALELDLEPPRMRGDSVWVDVRLRDPLADRVQESLRRGMPATLELRAELWHRRRGWFDRLEETVVAGLRIQYRTSSRTYRIERRGAPAVIVPTMDSLQMALQRPFAIPAGRIRGSERSKFHFIVVTAVLRPLSVEDVAEIEKWLSGEVETKRRSGFGLVTQVPRALFDTVRNFAGFGDARARAISGDFSVDDVR